MFQSKLALYEGNPSIIIGAAYYTCGLFDSSRSGEGFLGAHMNTQTLHLHAQNARGTGQSLHGLSRQQEVDQGWL